MIFLVPELLETARAQRWCIHLEIDSMVQDTFYVQRKVDWKNNFCHGLQAALKTQRLLWFEIWEKENKNEIIDVPFISVHQTHQTVKWLRDE